MSYIKRSPLRNATMLIFFVTMVLAGAVSAPWALPRPVALGQTIPWPTDTATRAPTDTQMPTNTWTPRPTWTRAPTREPGQPTTTATQPVSLPTSIGIPEQGQPTPIASLTEPRLSPSPTLEPAALVLEVLVQPSIAGPGDEVRFLVQLANVGYGPANNVEIEAMLTDKLELRSVDCDRCTIGYGPGWLTITVGYLLSGDQVIAPVLVEVIEDAWPGQTLETIWKVTADYMPLQSALAILELPWAELPSTGLVSDNAPGIGQREWVNE